MTSDQREATAPISGRFPLVPVSTAPEHADHPTRTGPSRSNQVPGRRQGGIQAGRGVGIVHQHDEGRTGLDTTSIRPGTGSAPARPAAIWSSSTPSESATVAASRALSTLNRPDSGRVTGRPRHRNEDEPTEVTMSSASERGDPDHPVPDHLVGQSVAPGVVHVDHGHLGPVGIEQPGLGPEVRLHGAVMVEVIAAQVGEGRHVEHDAVHPVLFQPVGRHLHGHRPVPSARRSARWAWSTGASGVVRSPSNVPITPVGVPAWLRIERTRWVTVVLPLVPVTPTMVMAREGWPLKVAATEAMAGLTPPAATRTWVTSRSRNRSHSSDVAPAVTAGAACRWPSVRSPGTQQNRAPGTTRRLSKSLR